jgi:GNAT superfamily N-acetyltransferase
VTLEDYIDAVARFNTVEEVLVDNAVLSWCVGPSKGDRPGGGEITVCCELTDRQLRDLYSLWSTWAEETGYPPPPPKTWCQHVVNRIHSGSICPIIARDGDYPVGCVDVTQFLDPFTGLKTAMGDHAYVRPEYRGRGVFKQMMDAALFAGALYEAERLTMPVSTIDAPFLQRLYEKQGFRHTCNVLERLEGDPCLKH